MRIYSGALRTIAALAVILLAGQAVGQQAVPARPRITGISHVGYFVSDLPKALEFWHGLLGFDEYYSLARENGKNVRIAFIKINDRQHVELFTDPPPSPPSHMSHVCFSVDDVDAMRRYLAANGITVPAKVTKTHAGDLAFEVHDPDGTLVEFAQMLPDGMESKAAGKFLPESRISSRIYHVGFLVGNLERAMEFYGKLLGFQETWRGTANPAQLSWINMRVPDGTDYVEFMLYDKVPTDYGGKNHTSLVVPDVNKAVSTLQARPAFQSYGRPVKVATGVNQKRQVNLFDPDGTRVELMEENTITGKPTPSSTAPPPPPAHP